MITDTHTHLYSEQFDEDRELMIQRAKDAGVHRFFIPAIDSSYSERMFSLEENYPSNVFLMMGLHPTSVKENFKSELQHVKDWIAKKSFVAIGEIGIDLYWDKTFLKEQQEASQLQIQWAKQQNLPIVIHCRDAFDEIFEILELEKALSYNMKLGIGGVATFKNGKIDTFLSQIPLQHIVLETDAPYLSPSPHRGKRNESSYITYVIEKLATIYKLSFNEIANITTENSKKVFGI